MEDEEFMEQIRLAEQESLWESQAQSSQTNSGPLSKSQLRLQEVTRGVSAYNRAKLAQSQTSAQSLNRQRTALGTPAQAPSAGRLSTRTSNRFAPSNSSELGRQRNGTALTRT